MANWSPSVERHSEPARFERPTDLQDEGRIGDCKRAREILRVHDLYANPLTLLLIPSYAKRGVEPEVATNNHPTMDYFALQADLGADLADYTEMEADNHPLVRSARRLSPDAALA